jgi:hypothetical protein
MSELKGFTQHSKPTFKKCFQLVYGDIITDGINSGTTTEMFDEFYKKLNDELVGLNADMKTIIKRAFETVYGDIGLPTTTTTELYGILFQDSEERYSEIEGVCTTYAHAKEVLEKMYVDSRLSSIHDDFCCFTDIYVDHEEDDQDDETEEPSEDKEWNAEIERLEEIFDSPKWDDFFDKEVKQQMTEKFKVVFLNHIEKQEKSEREKGRFDDYIVKIKYGCGIHGIIKTNFL